MSSPIITLDFRQARSAGSATRRGGSGTADVVSVTRFSPQDPLTRSLVRALRAAEAFSAELAAANASIDEARSRLLASIAAVDAQLARRPSDGSGPARR